MVLLAGFLSNEKSGIRSLLRRCQWSIIFCQSVSGELFYPAKLIHIARKLLGFPTTTSSHSPYPQRWRSMSVRRKNMGRGTQIGKYYESPVWSIKSPVIKICSFNGHLPFPFNFLFCSGSGAALEVLP